MTGMGTLQSDEMSPSERENTWLTLEVQTDISPNTIYRAVLWKINNVHCTQLNALEWVLYLSGEIGLIKTC